MREQRGSRLRAGFAAVLSLVMPGLGQVHARAWRIGLVLLAVNEALSMGFRVIGSMTAPTVAALGGLGVLLLASLGLMGVAAVDAWRRVRAATVGPRPRWFRSTWFTAIVLVAFGFGVDAALPFGWRSFVIPSASMVPALLVGDYVIADARPGLAPARGDVVVFTLPRDPAVDYVKRVIGLAGDRVAVEDGRIVLNGVAVPQVEDGTTFIEEPMRFGTKARRAIETLPGGPAYPVLALEVPSLRFMAEQTVPAGQVFVMGDNRDNSLDSRSPLFGLVAVGDVVGRAMTFYWSPDRKRIFTSVH